MKTAQFVEQFFKRFFPSPFALAILLSLITLFLGFLIVDSEAQQSSLVKVLQYWQSGFWNEALLVFAYQMMLILVLGHILVLSKPMQRFLDFITSFVNNNTSAILFVSITTLLVAFLNWGLGLIFGAILVRKIGAKAQAEGFKLNYSLLGATGYVGMMAWHGGLSGSAPLKASESNHLTSLFSAEKLAGFGVDFPSSISTSETIFSLQNISIYSLLILFVPIIMLVVAQKKSYSNFSQDLSFTGFNQPEKKVSGAMKIEHSRYFTLFFGALLLVAFFASYYTSMLQLTLTPNMLNFLMLSLGVLFHQNLFSLVKALGEAIKGAGGILIQFPIYFGIMGVMKESGMVTLLADFFISIANETFLPILTFISAGIVNVFVPSGGGQWAIQGPISIEAATKSGVSLPKMIMALAYGDQATNMLQPFWALPLLAITKLKASEILPYTLILFVAGSLIFILGLLFVF
ncbi:MAG: short-chain fatty acid transporter [Bacteroidota bacterium]